MVEQLILCVLQAELVDLGSASDEQQRADAGVLLGGWRHQGGVVLLLAGWYHPYWEEDDEPHHLLLWRYAIYMPADTWRSNNVIIMSKRRHDVVLT